MSVAPELPVVAVKAMERVKADIHRVTGAPEVFMPDGWGEWVALCEQRGRPVIPGDPDFTQWKAKRNAAQPVNKLGR